METKTTPDKIEKKIVLRATRTRVWQAISNSSEFGTWFGMKIDGPFVAGKTIRGTITPTKVDPAIAKMQEPFDGTPFELEIETIEPESVFAFRWHPNAVEPKDYSKEPKTLVTFTLADASDGEGVGVLLTVTESGFDKIPLERRAKAFADNEGGWEAQTKLIEKYLAQQTNPSA